MKRKNVELIALSAIFIAVVAVLTFSVKIPIGTGYISFIDVGIFFAAVAFGPIVGFLAGGIGGGLADVISGYPQWMIATLIIHGTQGLVVGLLCRKGKLPGMIFGWLTGAVIVVGGYVVAGLFLEGWGSTLAMIPYNLIQVAAGILGFPLYILVRKAWPRIITMGKNKEWKEEK